MRVAIETHAVNHDRCSRGSTRLVLSLFTHKIRRTFTVIVPGRFTPGASTASNLALRCPERVGKGRSPITFSKAVKLTLHYSNGGNLNALHSRVVFLAWKFRDRGEGEWMPTVPTGKLNTCISLLAFSFITSTPIGRCGVQRVPPVRRLQFIHPGELGY